MTNEETTENLRKYCLIVYALYGFGLIFGGVPTIAGVILAYVKRGDFSGTIYESHMTWLIRTFWWGLLWGGLCIMASFISFFTFIFGAVGFVLFFLFIAWYLYRLVIGFVRFFDKKPMYAGKN